MAVADTICMNMMVDEKGLRLPAVRHDVFTAHEIVQLRPLFTRGARFDICLRANTWVIKFMPNCFFPRKDHYHKNQRKRAFFHVSVSKFLTLLEPFAKQLQLFIMRSKRTTEVVSDSLLAFHPIDYRKMTLAEFSKRLEAYGAL